MQNKGELWARVVQSKYGGWQGMLAADRPGLESVWWRDLKKTLIHSPQGQIMRLNRTSELKVMTIRIAQELS